MIELHSIHESTVLDQIAAFRANVIAARDRLGLSQGEFALQVGVSQRCISKIEKGQSTLSFPVALAIGAFLAEEEGASLDQLVRAEGGE